VDRLRWRGISLLDVALAVGIMLVGLAELAGVIPGSDLPGPRQLSLLFVVATAVPLVVRRVAPLTVFFCVIVIEAVWQFSEYSVDQQQTFESFLAILLAVFGAGVYTRGRTAAAAMATLGVGVVMTAVDLLAGAPLGLAIPPTLMIIGVFVLGRLLAGYRVRTREAIERMVRAERDAEEAGRLAVAQERARIARELHDVVSHDVSFIVVQASVERRLRAARADGGSGATPGNAVAVADDVLASIEIAGRDALTELRRMLGVLRHADEDTDDGAHGLAPLEPQPSLARLDELVDQVRAAGLAVSVCRQHQDCPPLPSGLELAAFRIVQESLTNVIKHVGPTKVSVTLRTTPGELEIEVVDAGPARPSGLPGGHGVIGMRERVALFGGSLTTGRHGRGYRVHARLPLAQPA
jgi:signal transduction histidine kinase